jgi:hypothetical protein
MSVQRGVEDRGGIEPGKGRRDAVEGGSRYRRGAEAGNEGGAAARVRI